MSTTWTPEDDFILINELMHINDENMKALNPINFIKGNTGAYPSCPSMDRFETIMWNVALILKKSRNVVKDRIIQLSTNIINNVTLSNGYLQSCKVHACILILNKKTK